MQDMKTDERAAIEALQSQLGQAKECLRGLIKSAGKLATLVEGTAGKKSSNAVMRLRGQIEIALGHLDTGHADASDALIDGFANGGEIVAYGPGR